MYVRDMEDPLDITRRGWSSTLSARVRLVISRLALIFVLPRDFHGRVRVVRTMFIPCALHGIEASFLSKGSFLKLRAAVLRVAVSAATLRFRVMVLLMLWLLVLGVLVISGTPPCLGGSVRGSLG